ncbi:MAG TPA: carbon-nitrogen hydrolase family protein [Candidatus Hydrogenedentes bacterium]|nr:carbon-nitrogen hydrolase family protein [Candidatus Hydrogenedentota bacterium]HQH54440.1 carbon-nitrogen hydrolase family protein [Candidatus Hydrogenedentota bacterium]
MSKPRDRNTFTRRAFIGAGATGIGLAASAGAANPRRDKKKPREQRPAAKEQSMGPKEAVTITMVQLTTGPEAPPPIERMPLFFEKAADLGSDLVVFPEYVLGDTITPTDAVAREFFALAAKHKINAVTGCVEKHGTDQWSTSAWVVDRAGNFLGRYLKCHPASGPEPHFWPPNQGNDREARGILGSEFKVFTLDCAPVGILQCYDGYFPEAWGCTSYMGAEIILWINGRFGMVEDSHCIMAAQCYGCVVGANITMGFNTGFAGPGCVTPAGGYSQEREQARLYPRIKDKGDACVSASINLAELRWKRKHLRTMHQRRPELYGLLTRDVKMWQNYPEIQWDFPECAELVNKAQL